MRRDQHAYHFWLSCVLQNDGELRLTLGDDYAVLAGLAQVPPCGGIYRDPHDWARD